jgi:hypothetical protein
VLVFWVFDRGRVISPATTRVRMAGLEQLQARRYRTRMSAEAGD